MFEDLTVDPPTDEKKLQNMWKLYFLSIIGHTLREYEIPSNSQAGRKLNTILQEAGLLPTRWDLRRVLRAVRDYLSRPVAGVESGVNLDNMSGSPTNFYTKILFTEPTREQRADGYQSVTDLIDYANEALSEYGSEVWILLDRLDVAFTSSLELEENALRALFRVYLDLERAKNISLKIFLRTDIWNRISDGGFREASHITDVIHIKWNLNSLLNLVARRLLQNEPVCEFLGVEPETLLRDIDSQQNLIRRVFPEQIDVGEKKPTTFRWMLLRIRDGTKKSAPRELIHLLNEAKNKQINRIGRGEGDLPKQQLIGRGAFREALPIVSDVRLKNTLYAEYPQYKPWLEDLEGEKTKQFPETLADIWGVSDEAAIGRADKLIEVGFFEERGDKTDPAYWTPFLYRSALSMSQGSAEL